MPPKIRELKSKLRKSGFDERNAKGSHTRWIHSTFREVYVTISGRDGADAKPYQEDEVALAIKAVEARRAEQEVDE